MKLTELLTNQRIVVQIIWGEQKIEFFADVLGQEEGSIYVTPYIHNGSVLELNVNGDRGVICNIFADEPGTNKRISWKAVELTTVSRNDGNVYYIKTRGFNNIANFDDRRLHERVTVYVNAICADGQTGDEENVVIRNISDTGIAFHARKSFVPKSQQIIISFSDKIGDRIFDIKVDCAVSRVSSEDGMMVVGCRILGENKNYQIYGLIKRLKSKSNNVSNEAENNGSENATSDNSEPEESGNTENTIETADTGNSEDTKTGE